MVPHCPSHPLGAAGDANINTLGMLTKVETKLEELRLRIISPRPRVALQPFHCPSCSTAGSGGLPPKHHDFGGENGHWKEAQWEEHVVKKEVAFGHWLDESAGNYLPDKNDDTRKLWETAPAFL